MNLTLTTDESQGEVHVWAHLAPEDGSGETDVTRMTEAFIIGTGPTQDAAVRDALKTIENAGTHLLSLL